jgi:hypothetical protein
MDAFTYPDWSVLPLLYGLVISWAALLVTAVIASEARTLLQEHHPLGLHRQAPRGA